MSDVNPGSNWHLVAEASAFAAVTDVDGNKHAGADLVARLGGAITRLTAENARLREALKRLSSPEAFCVSRMATEEETERMKFAHAALETPNDPH